MKPWPHGLHWRKSAGICLATNSGADPADEWRRRLYLRVKKKGTTTVLVTGGFTYFAKDIAAQAGFDFVHGNQLDIKDGHLTGRVIPPFWISRLNYLSCRTMPPSLACLLMKPWPSETGQMICPCWKPPDWGLDIIPNRCYRKS
ncbi:MAG: haloacid dehalogenase-like hydrolase [Rhodospirillales bacterium]|nr:haloacid dehalogenase-like hydrolase [Rhodospirillales bacterium]